MNKPFLFPAVQSLVLHKTHFQRRSICSVCVSEEYAALFDVACSVFPAAVLCRQNDGHPDVRMHKITGIPAQSYQIFVRENGIELCFSEKAGAFYALITLIQLCNAYNKHIPCMEIEDAPQLKLRGVLLDVSRGKIPTLDTLKQTVDYMARCKLNHLQLYFEGFSFAYASHKQVWEKETPITPQELRELDAYCRARYIDLVPCQNTLGHMTRWLERPEFNGLAECSDGFTVMGHRFPPTTLDAADKNSFSFVTGLLDELLPCFHSDYCNVCLDEPFELGMGKNEASKAKKYHLYSDYASKLHAHLAQHKKQMMMWGDVIARDHAILDRLPDDVLILDWGYEAEYPAEERAALLAQSGHPFCLCPGTNSWLSFTGITDNMLTCIQNAAQAARRHNALGLIVTDWGDMGHLQYLPVSWAGIFAAACCAWNINGFSQAALARALDVLVFEDSSSTMGQLVLDAGRYVQFEEFRLPCRTLAATVLSSGLLSQAQYAQFLEKMAKSITFFSPECVCRAYLNSYENKKDLDTHTICAYLEALLQKLEQTNLQCKDKALVIREYKNALRLTLLLTKLRTSLYGNVPPAELQAELCTILQEHCFLWMRRNKPHGCEEGLRPLTELLEKTDRRKTI